MLEINGLNEYNNAGALYGVDGLDDTELLGAIQRMNPVQRAMFMKKLTANPSPSIGSRGEMERFFNELPKHIKEGTEKGEMRLADNVIYSIKKVGSKTVKMFETQDTKAIGLNSLSAAKLPKNQAFLVSGIIVLAGVSGDLTPDRVMSTTFGKIEDFPALCTGEFSLKANKKIILPETSMNIFKTQNFNRVPVGYYKLANPRLIHDDVLIEATFELGTVESLNPNTHIYLGLHGTTTTP
jgi:hypothetical protein